MQGILSNYIPGNTNNTLFVNIYGLNTMSELPLNFFNNIGTKFVNYLEIGIGGTNLFTDMSDASLWLNSFTNA